MGKKKHTHTVTKVPPETDTAAQIDREEKAPEEETEVSQREPETEKVNGEEIGQSPAPEEEAPESQLEDAAELEEPEESEEVKDAENTEDAAAEPSENERMLAEYKEKFLRMAAEYDNFRKRTRKENESRYTMAVADTAAKFLPIHDNLERALSHQTEDAAFYKGVEMIKTELDEAFEKLGIRPIEALGQPFDPALHDAVMHIEDDSGEENVVVEVFKAGFILDDRVMRPAIVKVKN